MFFDPVLKQQERGNADQQNSDGSGDEGVYTVAVNRAEMAEQTHAHDGAGNAATSQADHDSALHRAFFDVHNAGANFGDKVEESVRTHGDNRRDTQEKNEDGQQQDSTADARHANECPNNKADQNFFRNHKITCRKNRALSVIAIDPDKAFALEVQNDLLCGFFWRQVASVNHHFRILGRLVGIGNAGEFFEDAGSRFRI